MDPKKPAKEIVDLSPKNAEYASKIQQARGVQHPVGGAPMPKMPNFAEAQEQGSRYQGVQNQTPRRGQGMATILTPQERQQLEAQGRAIPGVGSAYAANQPGMKHINQEQTQPGGYQNPPRPAGAGLSEQTAEQLAAVAKANATDAPPPQPSAEQMKKEIDDLEDDIFDYDEFGNKVKNLLANKERREQIEARCEPMDLMDLLVNREARQIVPIIPGKYFPSFRTMGGDEDLEVKRLMSVERGSTQYMLSKLTLMNLVCGLYSINGKVLPSHQDKDGEFDVDLFKAKFKNVIKYPMQVLSDLAVNYTWFDRRVRSLIALEPIKDF
jgi:hypothetical protein